jgi:hypothetical protein
VEGRPVLPAVPFPERVLVDHPRTCLALAALHHANPRHPVEDRLITTRRDRLVRRRSLQQPVRDPRQAGLAFLAIKPEQVGARRHRQQAP